MTVPREKIKSLWNEGFSAEEIGKRFGLTRNQVIGHLYRMKKKGEDVASKAPSPRKKAAPRKKYLPSSSPIAKPKPALKKTLGKFLLDLGPNECRWSVDMDKDRHLFCAKPITAGAYCAEHAAQVYRKIPGRD